MNGYNNEFNFINYLNEKKYKEVHILLQGFLKALFPNIKKEDTICAYKYCRYAKTDMVIDINGCKKGISIKSGARNSIHLEPIESFMHWLSAYFFEESDELLRYLYSDGSNNNTGNLRLSSNEYKKNHSNEINSINKSLHKIKYELIIRFLIKSDINYKISVDAFISGNLDNFIWATKEEVISYLMNNDFSSSGVHISGLFIQNWNKNLHYNPTYEHCRNYIQVKWYSMFDDFIIIMSQRKVTI